MIVLIFLEGKEDFTLDYWSECKTIQNCHRITKKAKVHFIIPVVVVVDIIIIITISAPKTKRIRYQNFPDSSVKYTIILYFATIFSQYLKKLKHYRMRLSA